MIYAGNKTIDMPEYKGVNMASIKEFDLINCGKIIKEVEIVDNKEVLLSWDGPDTDTKD